jgi:class 3 adenylate cyclase/CHASE2 domain-containing sensor protein
VKLKPSKWVPGLIALGVISLVCLVRLANLEFFERLEGATFDPRVRLGLQAAAPMATNLGFVYINEESVKRVWDGSLGFHFGLYWPRQVYGRLIQELSQQGAKCVALDVILGELRPDHASVRLEDGVSFLDSDEFFAMQARRAGNVILAMTPEVTPPPLFRTNAWALADISTEKDPDGVLRRANAFRTYRNWHWAFQQLEADPAYAVDLRQARVEARQIVIPRQGLDEITVQLDAAGNFDLADLGGTNLPPGVARYAKPFVEERYWHMGVVMAARALKLDLDHPDLDLRRRRITLHGPGGVQRTIPVDSGGNFYIDWSLPANDPRLASEAVQDLLAQYLARLEGRTNDLRSRWQGRLVLVGSSGVKGNNLTDRGATPLGDDTLLASAYWNVANSVLTGRFVQRASLPLELGLILALGVATGLITWRSRALTGFGWVVLMAAGYLAGSVLLYLHDRYWLPVVLPISGAVLTNYLCLVTWRVVFEQAEQRRVKSIFSMIVSPKIVQELLRSQAVSLEGARRRITVLFADVRGFTQLADNGQELVAEFVRSNRITGTAAEACFDEQARETLATVNLYLSLVADTVVQHDGTLDKFIGDCVMAFWGAPTPNPKHAQACVRAAIAAQRAIYELNQQRTAENRKREADNARRQPAGLLPRPLLPVLYLGTGINTGMATVGLMGGEAKAAVRQANYTVFGHEVNLASRLEGASGRGRIFIGEGTYQDLLQDDRALAATCLALPAQKLKGISSAVTVYEVPWRPADAPPLDEVVAGGAASQATSFTRFRRREEGIAPTPPTETAPAPGIPGKSQPPAG